MRVDKILIKTHPDSKRTRIYINGEECDNCRSVDLNVDSEQTHPTSVKLEFEGCIIEMVSQTNTQIEKEGG